MRILLKLTLSVFLFIPISIYAQSILDQAQYPKKPIADFRAEEKKPSQEFSRISDINEVPGYTDYDYIGGVGVPELFSPYDIDGDGDFDPVGVFNERFSETGNGVRRVAMFIGLGGEFASFNLIDTTLYSGWPTIQSITKGPWSGHAAVMFQQGSKTYLSLIDMSTLSQTTKELDFNSLSSSFCYLDDGTIYAIDSEGKLRKLMIDNLNESTETGIQFHQSAAVQPIKSSFNDEYLAVLGFTENDEVILYFSNDRGENWTEEVIAQNFVTEVDNRPGVFPLFTNFSQASYSIDNQLIVHIGMNGYGILVEDTDTSFIYPALYWNSKNRDWIAVSDQAEEGEELNGLYPGNGIGNAYPTPIVSKDGFHLGILYQAPEFIDGELQIFNMEDSIGYSSYYYTDIKFSVIDHNGYVFYNQKVSGMSHQSDIFPTAYDFWEYYSETLVDLTASIQFIYFVDVIPGCSVLNENNFSDNSFWACDTVNISVSVVNILDENKTNNYILAQNYPNPFNPTTTIKINIASPGESGTKQSVQTSLTVYDILGRKIKTLLNKEISPGSYEVNFDASNLSSGIYLYKLTSGSFTQTRKMILLR